jgi:uncharacterized protein YbjT (DUF2867 family)
VIYLPTNTVIQHTESLALTPVRGGGTGKEGSSPVSRDDLASVLVAALAYPPQSASRTVLVEAGKGGSETEWESIFAAAEAVVV